MFINTKTSFKTNISDNLIQICNFQTKLLRYFSYFHENILFSYRLCILFQMFWAKYSCKIPNKLFFLHLLHVKEKVDLGESYNKFPQIVCFTKFQFKGPFPIAISHVNLCEFLNNLLLIT